MKHIEIRRIMTILLLPILCMPFLLGIAADPKAECFYVARDGTRSPITTEERADEFLKANVPDGIKDRRIHWDHWEPPSRPYANQKSVKLPGGYVVTSTLYMKNCYRIITVSSKDVRDRHRVVFYQDSTWSGDHIERDERTGGVKMAIDRDRKSFAVISTSGKELMITLPAAQQGTAEQPAAAGGSK